MCYLRPYTDVDGALKNGSQVIASNLCPEHRDLASLGMCIRRNCSCSAKDSAASCETRTRVCTESAQVFFKSVHLSTTLFDFLVSRAEALPAPGANGAARWSFFPSAARRIRIVLVHAEYVCPLQHAHSPELGTGRVGLHSLVQAAWECERLLLNLINSTNSDALKESGKQPVARYDKEYLKGEFRRLLSLPAVSNNKVNRQIDKVLDYYTSLYKLNEVMMSEWHWYWLYSRVSSLQCGLNSSRISLQIT